MDNHVDPETELEILIESICNDKEEECAVGNHAGRAFEPIINEEEPRRAAMRDFGSGDFLWSSTPAGLHAAAAAAPGGHETGAGAAAAASETWPRGRGAPSGAPGSAPQPGPPAPRGPAPESVDLLDLLG